eukprot:scaffold4395_cov123-Isochrysis_galbana.AAC.7
MPLATRSTIRRFAGAGLGLSNLWVGRGAGRPVGGAASAPTRDAACKYTNTCCAAHTYTHACSLLHSVKDGNNHLALGV